MLPISKKACPRIVEADRSIDLTLEKFKEQGRLSFYFSNLSNNSDTISKEDIADFLKTLSGLEV